MTFEPSDDRARQLAAEALAEVNRIAAIGACLREDLTGNVAEAQELAIAIRISQYFVEQFQAHKQQDMKKFDEFANSLTKAITKTTGHAA
jgi:hypothetical protein